MRAMLPVSVLVSVLSAASLAAASDPPPDLHAVNDFTYQLQGKHGEPLDLAPIAASAFDLCIIDFSRDGSDEFAPAEIAALRSSAEPARIRLAYMSIGEAEKYRWYFDEIDADLVAAANPQWQGNFKVRYWEPEWQEVIIHGNAAVGASYLDRILDQGFDGVYLDIVDAFEFFGPKQAGGKDVQRDAARRMVEFIAAIAYHARVTRGHPDFLVVPQNGANILDPEWYPADTLGGGDPATPALMAAQMQATLFAAVNAIGVEDVFFFGKKSNNNALKPQQYILQQLEAWVGADLPVLSIEYVSKAGKVDKFYGQLAPDAGFVPYATVRSLNQLKIPSGHAPD